MTGRLKATLTASAIGLGLFAAGAYTGFRFEQSRKATSSADGRIEQISWPGWKDDWRIGTGSSHQDTYDSVLAFGQVGRELPGMLRSIAGENHRYYRAYVLPEVGGYFSLVIHHDPSAPHLTREQVSELVERVRTRLGEETFGRRQASQ